MEAMNSDYSWVFPASQAAKPYLEEWIPKLIENVRNKNDINVQKISDLVQLGRDVVAFVSEIDSLARREVKVGCYTENSDIELKARVWVNDRRISYQNLSNCVGKANRNRSRISEFAFVIVKLGQTENISRH